MYLTSLSSVLLLEVATTIVEKFFTFETRFITRLISGSPAMCLKALPGNREEPIREKMIAATFMDLS